MSVSSKIMLVACLAFLPILGVHSWRSLEREKALFRSDMERDLSLLGSTLREMAVLEWSRSGAEGVRKLLHAADLDSRVALEWRDQPEDTSGLTERQGTMVWVEPVAIDGKTVGEIVLAEPLAPMYAYLRETLVWLALLTLLLISAGLLSARLLSHRLVGQRLDRLMGFAADIGSGKLGERLEVGGRDEIAQLASSLGAMSESLAQARREAERLDQERLGMLQQLRHADRLATLGRLAGSVAHEIGTPLNVILGHANRISEGSQAPAETKESAATIHRHVKRMETTIRDILGFVRQSRDADQVVDLTAAAKTVCGLLRPLAERREVELEVDARPEPAHVRGHEVQLEQALSNLVSNAIDASPAGGRVSVAISEEERSPKRGGPLERVMITRVRDQGPGIAADDIDRLFEPFYTSKAAGQGTGLGLWLAEGIVRDHGGTIEVENRPEGGACFSIVLPLSRD